MEIPDPIKEEVMKVGGLEGISEMIPADEDLERTANAYKALSDPIRLKILKVLMVQPLCVCCIKEIISVQDSKLSYHLSRLRDAGLIVGRQEKNWIIYSPTESAKDLF